MSEVSYEYQGIHGLSAIARTVGISAGALYYRIHRTGMTMEEAVTQGKTRLSQAQTVSKYEYQGVYGLKKISKLTGIKESTLHHRICVIGMTVEQAVAQGNKRIPSRRRSIPVTKAAADRAHVSQRQYVAVKYPDLLSVHWKLALGMEATP